MACRDRWRAGIEIENKNLNRFSARQDENSRCERIAHDDTKKLPGEVPSLKVLVGVGGDQGEKRWRM